MPGRHNPFPAPLPNISLSSGLISGILVIILPNPAHSIFPRHKSGFCGSRHWARRSHHYPIVCCPHMSWIHFQSLSVTPHTVRHHGSIYTPTLKKCLHKTTQVHDHFVHSIFNSEQQLNIELEIENSLEVACNFSIQFY